MVKNGGVAIIAGYIEPPGLGPAVINAVYRVQRMVDKGGRTQLDC